ncbi:MAG: lipid-binding SYLF domain-containing protein [Magnetovibrionaceae bacterium]
MTIFSHFRRSALALGFLVTLGACANVNAPAPVQTDALVDKARKTIEAFKVSKEPNLEGFRERLAQASGVMILPSVVKAGFLVGGETGHGLLLARDDQGNWSYPAFYTAGSGSVGFQLGAALQETVIIIRSPEALAAVIKDQGRFGGEVGVAGPVIGAGKEGATTTNLGLDLIAYSRSLGAFGGLSLEGGAFVRRNDFNEAFYAPGATPEAIIAARQFSNPKADPLIAALKK